MLRSRQRPILLLFAVTLLIGVSGSVGCPAADVKVQRGIAYGTGGDTVLKLDLAEPTQREGLRPAVIFIHGGGWLLGSRGAHSADIRQAAERGFVAVSISYRLMNIDRTTRPPSADPVFPAQVHDAKAAVRWLRANAAQYQVDPERIGVVGFSAGGHLALMLGLTDPSAGLEGDGGNADQSSRVQAVVNFFGPTEMISCYRNSALSWLFPLILRGTPEQVAETYRAASPVTYASRHDPPVLTIQGDKDNVVPVQQARLLDQKMREARASHTLIILAGQPHGIQGKYQQSAFESAYDFLDQYLKKTDRRKGRR